MTKTPKSSPHSDIEGVHQDERRNVDVAAETGQDSADLARAGQETVARPPYSEDEQGRDDRTG